MCGTENVYWQLNFLIFHFISARNNCKLPFTGKGNGTDRVYCVTSCFQSIINFYLHVYTCTYMYISSLWCIICFYCLLSYSPKTFYTTNVFPYNYRYEGYGGNLNIKTLIISFLGQIERAKLFRTEDRICATDLWNDWLH